LRFGVDPRAEADAVVKLYSERQEPVALRIVGRDFTALGFMNRAGVSTRVRVVTAMGIVLALDPDAGSSLQPAARYALLAPPLPHTQDADGDGFEEVFVEVRTDPQTCLSVYRVRDVGYVDLVPTQVELFGRERCPTGVADIDGDGSAELWVDIEFVDFAGERPPRVRVPLWSEQHRFVPRDESGRVDQFVTRERQDRQSQLEAAQRAQDVREGMRLAVELAALQQILDRPASEQLAVFDSAVAGLHAAQDAQTSIAEARTQVERGWIGVAISPVPAVSPTPPPAQLAESETSWYITPSHEQEGQKQVGRRPAHLSKSKGRAKLRRGGAHRSGHRAHGVRGQKPASQARGHRGRVRGH
jgi:hypothetical protein